MARWRSFSVILTFALVSAGMLSADAAFVGPRRTLLSTSKCHQYGGYCIGQQGAPGTIYAGHILSWADDFPGASPNVVGPQAPNGAYFATKGYGAGPNGQFSTLGTQFDTSPLSTGYNDSNRGVPVGWTNLSQTSNVLSLGARLATSGEQSNMYFTSHGVVSNGVRVQVSSGIHGAGVVGWYPPTTGTNTDIVECLCQFTGNSQAGWHPDFWVQTVNPLSSFVSGSFDSINACEGNSFTCNSSINHITNGTTTIIATGSNFTTLYNGSSHMLSFELGASATKVDIDGVNSSNFAFTSNFAALPQTFFLTSHVYNATWLGEAYSQGAWNSTGAKIQAGLLRVWRPVGTKHLVPEATIPDLSVSYNGTASESFPSTLALWGDAGASEYCQAVPDEANEPGMGFNTIYQQLPAGVTCDTTGRTVSADFSAQNTTCAVQGCRNAGVIHMVLGAWKTDGSTYQPVRFNIYRGPRQIARGGNITIGSSSSVDIYASCGVGIATPKTIGVTGLPSGMTYSSSTGLATGTPTADVTASVTCANNIGQSITYNYVLGPLQNETYALEQRMTNQPNPSAELAVDTAIASLKTDGLWSNLWSFSFMGLGDSQASLLNWVGDYWNPALLLTPTFSAYNGFTTDGTSNAIDTAFNPSIYSNLNAIAFSVLSNTTGQSATGGIGNIDASSNGITLNLRNSSDQVAYRANDATAATIANANGSGLFTSMRSGATTKKAYRAGAQIGTTLTTASTSMPNATIGIGRTYSPPSPPPTFTYSARQWENYAIRFGSFADADEANLNSIIASLKADVQSGLTLGAINTQGSWIDVGSHSALQWERTQAWTGAAYVSLAAAPSGAFPAAIIFTTAQAGLNITGAAAPQYPGYEWWIDSNCHLRVRLLSNQTTNNYLGAIGSLSFCDGNLHKVAASYDGSSTVAGVKMYVDGTSDTGITSEGTALSGTIVNAEPFYIGNQRDWPYSLGGTIQHFSLSNVVRNQAWVQSYTTAAASVDANTVLAYDFAENTGKTTADASANAFTASVCNATWQSGTVGNAPCLPQGAVSVDQGATPLSSVSASLPVNVASGSAIAGSVDCACVTGLTVTDDKGNSYTVLGPNTGLAGVQYWQFYATNLTNGPHTVTATLTSGTGTFWRMQTNEVANVIATVDGNALAYTASATGANGLSSGSITTTINNDFIFGDGTEYNTASLAAGTNFSIGNTIFGAQDNLWSEYYWQPTAGAIAATFTPSSTTRGHAGGIAFRTQ